MTWRDWSTACSPKPAEQAAFELAEELGHLSLALDQAAAYIADRTALTCRSNLCWWTGHSNHPRRLLSAAGEWPDGYQQTVTTTWSVSIDLADHCKPVGLARPLVEIASVLDPQRHP